MSIPFPQKHPLCHAFQEFKYVDTAYQKMIGLDKIFLEYDAAWREVLYRLERVWSKTEAAVNTKPGWPKIKSEFAHLRNTDSLLQYMIHARNANEHSIQDICKEYELNLSTTFQEDGIEFRWSPWDRPLLPIKNRNITYNPPRIHLGINIEHLFGKGKAQPRVVAELAIQFYIAFLNRVSLEVVGNDYSA